MLSDNSVAPPGIGALTATPNGTLTVSGTATPGDTVTAISPDGSVQTAVADSSGDYSVTSSEPQQIGQVSVTSTDLVGNVSPASGIDYTPANSATAAPGVGAIIANPDGTLTVTGACAAGHAVTVAFPDGSTQTASADGKGDYSATSDTVQSSGPVSVTQTDRATGQSNGTVSTTYTDLTPPQPPGIGQPSTDADGNALVAGTAEPGAVVTVIWPDGSISATDVDAGGHWSVVAHVQQSSGDVTAIAIDAAGNSSPVAIAQYTDITAPTARAVISSYIDDAGAIQGEMASAADDTTPLLRGGITGRLGEGETVIVYRDGVMVGEAFVTGSTWRWQDSGLRDGQSYAYTVRVQNQAGSSGPDSPPFIIAVGARAPAATAIITSLDVFDDQSSGGIDLVTSDTEPLLQGVVTGTLEPGNAIVIYRNNVMLGIADVTSDGDGNFAWTYQDIELEDGHAYTYQAVVQDAAGNRGEPSEAHTLTIDATPSAAMALITGLVDAQEPIAGQITNGGVTNDTEPLLQGCVSGGDLGMGEVVLVYRDGVLLGQAAVDGTPGNLSWTYWDSDLQDGRSCQDSGDHWPIRSWPLLRARRVMREVLSTLQ